MNTIRLCLLLLIASLLAGCFGPDYNAIANRLRKENMTQAAQIAALKQQITTRDATIRDQQDRLAARTPPVATLPPDRLAQVFTASRLEIRGQTDTSDTAEGKGLTGFRVFIRLYADSGEVIPATGTLTIDAIEIPAAPAEPRRIGTWTFTPQQMKASWYTALGSNYFAFNCPWASPPAVRDVTFKARFQDALTGQTLEATLTKKVTLPPAAVK